MAVTVRRVLKFVGEGSEEFEVVRVGASVLIQKDEDTLIELTPTEAFELSEELQKVASEINQEKMKGT